MAEKILIVDDDLDTLRLVGMMLQRQGYEISAATNGQQGLAKAAEELPDLIVLDVMMPDLDGFEVVRRLRKDAQTASIPILMFTAKTQLDDKVAGFEVGADDYLTKPTHPAELHAHVKALLARSTKSRQTAPTAALEHDGYVIGVVGARGGLGVSTLAANLAASLYARTKADVVLAELIPGQGTLALDLGISDAAALPQALATSPADLTRQAVKNMLVNHESGLRLLLDSGQPRDAQLVTQIEQFGTLVKRLSTLGRFVVLDLGSGLYQYVIKVLGQCDDRLLVVEGYPHSLSHSRALLSDLSDAGVDPKGITVVLNNRLRTDLQMSIAQAQELLGHSIALTVTPAPELLFQAVRTRKPAVLMQPESLTSQQFGKLAALLMEREAQAK